MLIYSIYSAVLLMCGYLVYRLFLADQRQHALNRAVLLSIYAASLIIPAIMLALPSPQPVFPNSADFGVVEIEGLQSQGFATDFDHQDFLLNELLRYVNIGYLVITGGMVLYLILSIVMLRLSLRSGKKIECDGFKLVLLDDHKEGQGDNGCDDHKEGQGDNGFDDYKEGTWKSKLAAGSPFSWGRYIVMSREDYEAEGELVLTHEREHLRCRHWIDLILAQAVIALQWYNPAAWLMRKELRKVHEYQADAAVADSGMDLGEYKRMLIEKAVGSRFHTLANSLNNSKLKNRITMFDKQNPSTMRRLSALLVVPAFAAGLAMMQLPAVAAVMDRLSVKNENAPQSVGKITEISSTGEISKLPVATAAVSAAATSAATTETTEAAIQSEKDSREVFTAVEQMAEFPGGMASLMKYLGSAIHYPENAAKAGIEGRVIVKFIIGEDGRVSGAEVVSGVDPELDTEAVRVVNSMPAWTPAKNKGIPVASYFTIPISFKLEAKTSKVEAKGAEASESAPQKEKNGHPSYLIDGKVYDALPSTLKSEDVKSMTVHKDPETCEKYGVNPEDGLIMIIIK